MKKGIKPNEVVYWAKKGLVLIRKGKLKRETKTKERTFVEWIRLAQQAKEYYGGK